MTVRKTWRCFHCDEEFVTTDAARDHFGATGESASACQIKAGAERSLLKELRRVEIELFNLLHQVHNEATETMKAMHSQSGRHQQQLTAVEELGYERGLADGRKENDQLRNIIKQWVAERKTFLSGETSTLREISERMAAAVGETIGTPA
jgi:hypothetical protein